MRERLRRLIDRPVTLRTLPDGPAWKPITGTVFDVRDDAVDVLLGASSLKTVAIAMIVDVAIDERAARGAVLEDALEHADYPRAKRALFEAEESVLLGQPAEASRARAGNACELLRAVRRLHPSHYGVERMLERAHFLARGDYAYEVEPETRSGELANHYYRWAKESAAKLDEGLRLRRPEDEIAGHIAAIAREAGRALAKYPNHADLLAWFARAEAIRKKLSEDVRAAQKLSEPFVAGKV